MKEYYDRRAPEYDEVWLGAAHQLPGWEDEVGQLCAALSALSPAPTLDVACGTGFLTRVLPGDVTGLDQSPAMLRIAGERVPEARFVQGDGLELPFADGSFERVFTSFFYGHLDADERSRFLAEARRVAPELVVADSALDEGLEPEALQERVLKDGSRWMVLKRHFTAAGLAAELGGGTVVHESRLFVVVAA